MTEEGAVFDDRVLFYLRHRADIEEWAALAGEASEAVDGYLRRLRPAIENRLAGGEEERLVRRFLDGNHRFLTGYERWPASKNGHWHISVALEWPKRTTLDHRGRCPYVGVMVPQSHDAGKTLGAKFRELADDTRKIHGWGTSPWWPVYRPVAAPASYWENLDSYREQLLDAIDDTWEKFGLYIDEALEGATPVAQPS